MSHFIYTISLPNWIVKELTFAKHSQQLEFEARQKMETKWPQKKFGHVAIKIFTSDKITQQTTDHISPSLWVDSWIIEKLRLQWS